MKKPKSWILWLISMLLLPVGYVLLMATTLILAYSSSALKWVITTPENFMSFFTILIVLLLIRYSGVAEWILIFFSKRINRKE